VKRNEHSPEYTGERVLPTAEYYKPTYLQTLIAYKHCLSYAQGKVVLDAGCGEGYGAHLLAEVAQKVIGADIDPSAIDWARVNYPDSNIEFVQTELTRTHLPSQTFDLICSSQVIEHIKNQTHFVAEMKRLLKPGGVLIIATPNLEFFPEGYNPFHYREFRPAELNELLGEFFSLVEMRGVFGSDKVIEYKKASQKFTRLILKLDVLNFRYRLPKALVVPVYSRISKYLKTFLFKRKSSAISSLTEQDFWVDQQNLSQCLDLLAVCHNE